MKPLLGLVNTVQCQVRGCGGEAPPRISEHCSVSGSCKNEQYLNESGDLHKHLQPILEYIVSVHSNWDMYNLGRILFFSSLFYFYQ